MIFVTGGAGFIGANFILEWFKAHNEAVVNIDKLTYAGNPENLASLSADENYTLAQHDIGDREALDTLLAQYHPRAVLNFAAESHVDRSIHAPGDFIQTNVVGTFQLLEAVRVYWHTLPAGERAAFRFLHISTDEVYGSLGPADPAFSETTPYAPNSPYSASKAASDHLVRAYFHTYGLPVLTTHCSNNYGPLQFPEKLIPLVIYNALAGKPLPIYGDGMNVRDWLFVGDHCAALRRVLEAGIPGEVYAIGGNSEMANLPLVQTLCALLDTLHPESPVIPHAQLISFVDDRPGHDRRYAINASKLKTELGWEPVETFESGLHKTVVWYLEHRAWTAHVVSGEYRSRDSRLYPARHASVQP